MQVFKAFLKVLTKRIPVALIWVAVFLVISIIISTSGSSTNLFTETTLDVCVFDEDNTTASKALTEFIGTKHNLISLDSDKDEILDALYYERADYVLTISSGYSEKLAAGETDNLFTNYHVHDSYSSALIGNLLDEYVGTVSAYLTSGESMDAAIQQAETALEKEISVKTENFDADTGGTSDYSKTFSYYFQYLPYVFLSVMIAALCPVLLTLSKKEIRNRTNCSCLSANSQTAQIFLGSTIFILAVWIIFMIAGAFLNGTLYSGRAWYAVLNSFLFILISAGIAILISAFSPSDTGVNVIANIIGLGMSFFCGIFVPQSMLGDGVLNFARFLPAYWYVKANDMLAGISGETFTTEKYLQYIGIETIFIVAIFAIAVLVMKVKHDKAD